MKIFNIVEIKLITKRQLIINALTQVGYIRAIKVCKELHPDWGLGNSVKYVKKLKTKYPAFVS